jgi:hypothetical protein
MAFSLGFSSQQHILLLLLPAYFDYLFSFSNLTPRCEGIPVCSTTTTTVLSIRTVVVSGQTRQHKTRRWSSSMSYQK